MKIDTRNSLTTLLSIIITCASLSCWINFSQAESTRPHVTLDAALAQTKVLQGANGTISVALTLIGSELASPAHETVQPVDLVVVLDRSGSMGGQKIADARNAVVQLINYMGRNDRMAIITYSDEVEVLSPLVGLGRGQREYLSALVGQVAVGGGTNLGGGLQMGIHTLMEHDISNRQRKVMLISDGLANQGITSPHHLGQIAARATEWEIGVSTVGVGYDFNEILMTTLADHGAGNYYFLESSQAFAEVFKKEFEATRNVVAGNAELRIDLPDSVHLVDAGGYPIHMAGNVAVIRLGNLLAGQQRRIYLTYRIPTSHIQSYGLGDMNINYRNNGEEHQVGGGRRLEVDCVADQKAVLAGINKKVWSEQVVKHDFNRLKNTVAKAVRSGRKHEALQAIEEYEHRTGELNSSVDSAEVSRNLESDLAPLRQSVEQTFAGAPAAVAEKRKQQAKELQYE
ncbi:MAG: VWA domain-containing protein, partial [Desulfopila sp.]|nr:VWA domain-containing protein [Desulfopila sp.]